MSSITAIKNQIAAAEANIYNLHLALQTAEAEAAASQRPIKTKFKWVSNENAETYRVAVQTKDGVLQVKSVTDGEAEYHENECRCGPCWEFATKAPWRPRKPLKQQLFGDQEAWYDSFDKANGQLTVTPPRISDKALKELCMKPLTATWESGQLEELQKRFPEGVFVLSSPSTGKQIEIKAHGMAIYSVNPKIVCCTFEQFFGDEKVQLMVEWKGLYIDLSHLF